MSATGAGYDQSVTTFSPNGRVFQVEYAMKAVEKSGTVVGVKCKDGVVMGVEKEVLSKMVSTRTSHLFSFPHTTHHTCNAFVQSTTSSSY